MSDLDNLMPSSESVGFHAIIDCCELAKYLANLGELHGCLCGPGSEEI